MADAINSTQQTDSTGSNAGVFRDVNASASLGEFLNNFGASTSSATSGNVTIGDRILGGSKASSQFGLLKILVIIAGAGILLKIYQQGAK